MVDIGKQVAYWREGSEGNWTAAGLLIDKGPIREGLFFAHLTLEKPLKAFVCRVIGDFAPKIHNLVRLATLARLDLNDGQMTLLARMNEFQLEGRYPDSIGHPPSPEAARELFARVGELREWLIRKS
jgi:HEPN domain-containing protein